MRTKYSQTFRWVYLANLAVSAFLISVLATLFYNFYPEGAEKPPRLNLVLWFVAVPAFIVVNIITARVFNRLFKRDHSGEK